VALDVSARQEKAGLVVEADGTEAGRIRVHGEVERSCEPGDVRIAHRTREPNLEQRRWAAPLRA
jgi:hypothetical protein